MKRSKWFKVGLFVTAIVATLTSGWYLISLGVRLGWSGPSAIGLPISLDVLAALAVSVWLDKTAPKTKRVQARKVALGAVSVSVLGNLAEHVYRAAETGAGYVDTGLAILIGVVAPLSAFLGFWLAEGELGKAEARPKPTEPKEKPETKAPTTTQRPTLIQGGAKRPKTEARAWIADQETRPTKRDVTSRFAIGGDPALALIGEVWDAREAAV